MKPATRVIPAEELPAGKLDRLHQGIDFRAVFDLRIEEVENSYESEILRRLRRPCIATRFRFTFSDGLFERSRTDQGDPFFVQVLPTLENALGAEPGLLILHRSSMVVNATDFKLQEAVARDRPAPDARRLGPTS